MVASDFNSDDDGDSWVCFSDRTGDGASTSMSSPDAYDYRVFLGDPPSYGQAFMGLILECMDHKQKLSVSDYEDWLFKESQNEQKFTDILSYLRLLTAIEICTEPERFAPHITGLDPVNPDVVGYCRQEVIPMDKEAEQEAPFALSDVLRVPLRIVYIAMSGNVEPNTHIIYESPHLPLVPCVTLLYRPGHYDILYR